MISIGVLAFVVGAIAVMLQTGTKAFSLAKSELDVQMESQTLLAQINTMIMESNSVHYDEANDVLTLYQIECKSIPTTAGSIGADDKKFIETKTVKEIKFIKYDSTDKKLYLYEHNHDQLKPADGGSLECTPECSAYSGQALFAEYISKFKVSVDKSNVTIQLGMENGKIDYEVDATSKIRNKLVTYP